MSAVRLPAIDPLGPPTGRLLAQHPAPALSARPTSPTTVHSPFVTLEPAGPAGHIPGETDDASDFYGLGAAVIAIVLVIVLARLVVGKDRPPDRQSRGER